MSVESLVVKLDADVKDFQRGMSKARKENDKFKDSNNKLGTGLKNVGAFARAAAVPIAGLAVGAGALGAALASMTLKAADSRRELESFARQAKVSASEFQGLAFAAKQYGVDAGQVADITKDISDRLGEFMTAGTGTFQDFADVMGMTEQQAMDAASALAEMSGPDAIQSMITQMQAAGASGEQMTFVLESMGNDLSKLLPLFKDNGVELGRMTERYNKFSEELDISESQAEDLKKVSESFDLMQVAIGKASTAISGAFAPILNDLINDVIDIVPGATNTVIDFFNSFRAADEIGLKSAERLLEQSNENIKRLEQQQASGGMGVLQQRKGVNQDDQRKAIEENLELERQRNEELRKQIEKKKELIEQSKLEAAAQREGGEIGGESGGISSTNKSKEDEDEFLDREEQLQAIFDKEQAAEERRLEMLREFAMTREEALIEQYQKELEMLAEYQEASGASDEEMYDRKLQAAQDFNKKYKALTKEQADSEDEKQKNIKFSMQDGVRVASQVGQMLFEDNKAVKAGLIVADTAAAIMKSLSMNPYDYGNVAVLATTGALQLANALSASAGGGSVSGGAGGGGTTITNRPEDFAPESTELEIGANIEGVGTSVNRVALSVDDSDDFIEELAERINRKRG